MGYYSQTKKQISKQQRIEKLILDELYDFVDLKSTLTTILKHIKNLTDCEAAGIRLHDDDDYLYYVYNGFPESFIEKESSLCCKDNEGNKIPSSDGKGYLLECMCGNVIRGRFDSSLPFFTENGSFWTNSTSALLAFTTQKDRQGTTRNYCHASGYESVALIPIKDEYEIIGLIQLNDKRINMFTEGLIEFLEMIAKKVGNAIQDSLLYDKHLIHLKPKLY